MGDFNGGVRQESMCGVLSWSGAKSLTQSVNFGEAVWRACGWPRGIRHPVPSLMAKRLMRYAVSKYWDSAETGLREACA